MIASIILGFLLQEPEAAPAPPALPEDARVLLERMAGAQGVELEFLGRIAVDGDEPTRLDVKGEFHAGDGRSGWLAVTLTDGGGEESSFEALGDGERVLLVDHEDRNWLPIGDSFGELLSMVPVLPLALWSGIVEVDQLQGAWEEAEPANPMLRVLAIRIRPEDPAEYLWFGPEDELLAVSTTIGAEDDGRATLHFYFHHAAFLAETDPADYRRSPPEDYTAFEVEMPDYEARLLAVGAEAPEVTFRDMEDREFTLASLRGRTVLLNFWFYH